MHRVQTYKKRRGNINQVKEEALGGGGSFHQEIRYQPLHLESRPVNHHSHARDELNICFNAVLERFMTQANIKEEVIAADDLRRAWRMRSNKERVVGGAAIYLLYASATDNRMNQRLTPAIEK
ncbi:hypothetical protein J6590_002039 [Homalodisca vitripennis]|nr:hypothetical protein J6590_002039 [Homalodisca vitripennis]